MLIRFNGKRQFRQIDALSKATTSIIDPPFPTPLTFYINDEPETKPGTKPPLISRPKSPSSRRTFWLAFGLEYLISKLPNSRIVNEDNLWILNWFYR